jgi:hypothetical protein
MPAAARVSLGRGPTRAAREPGDPQQRLAVAVRLGVKLAPVPLDFGIGCSSPRQLPAAPT